MHNNETDIRWATHLHYHWWNYVLLAVLSILIWTSVFDTLAKPERNEKVGIVLFGDELDVSALHTDLSAAIDDLTQQEIAYVDVLQTFADSKNLGSLLMARTYDYDLLVLTAETVDMLSAYGFFTPLPDYWENIPIYTQETNGASTAYGLEIYSPGCQNRFSTFCTGDQTYYVFLSKESVNLAGLNGNGAPTDDAALQVLNYLLEETNGPGKEN